MRQEVAPFARDQYENDLQLTEEREVVPNLARRRPAAREARRPSVQSERSCPSAIRLQDFADAARYARIVRDDFELI
jgi:hypothetical protein